MRYDDPADSSRTPLVTSAATATVLHVTDCYAGGIPVAIDAYVRNAPAGVEHHLLAQVPDGATLDEALVERFASVDRLGRSRVGAVLAIRRARRRIGADIVHAHSSFAGAYARVALRSSPRTRIVYTPHCYAFERADLSVWSRRTFRAVEWLLSFNVETIAACSEGEAAAAERRGPLRPRVVHVPNVVAVPPPGARRNDLDLHRPLRVASLGRIAPQKDPMRFAEAIASIRASGVEVAPVWMGGGRVEDATRLEAAGVDVTGWIPHAEVGSRLVQSDVYLHTAAWEGFPLAVLEAVQAGVPTLVRPIAAFGVVPDALTLEGGLEAMVASRLAGPKAFAAWAERNVSRWSERLKDHTPARQRAALAEAYRIPQVA
ncbi:Glycosyl transferases group 1 [Plantibacter flavus]|uniref:Glycosyl transferase family 1 n=1 Tax=Plantibacter flavus TaxID=150123 RepID=A0A3N2C4J3_9MICO|nr:glycosyltransferase family 4 protein [Plantibacter flavus]ROR82423.1 glycosyl transferase family 1 [Plantibacter flavus]SMG44064.1 Glycosyl transferases group 1 [Plantibacter flavus]